MHMPYNHLLVCKNQWGIFVSYCKNFNYH